MSDFFRSSLYLDGSYALGFAWTMAALAICAGAFWMTFWGIRQDAPDKSADQWRHRIKLMWADTFLLSLLFLVDSFAYRAGEFIAGSGRAAIQDIQPLMMTLQLAQNFALILLAFIAIRRLKALMVWTRDPELRRETTIEYPEISDRDQ